MVLVRPMLDAAIAWCMGFVESTTLALFLPIYVYEYYDAYLCLWFLACVCV